MISTLIVDDDDLTRELHRTYLERLGEFSVVGECSRARSAAQAVLEPESGREVDLVLLDMTMPDGTGVDVLRLLRSRRAAVDVIAITAARDAETVREMAALGVFQYLVKPFSFQTFSERLRAYLEHRNRSKATDGEATQAEIDSLLGRATGTISLPKGLSPDTLELVTGIVRTHGPLSAAEAAEQLDMSRVSVRRYLEHLSDLGTVTRRGRHGGRRGRPQTEYAWNRGRPSSDTPEITG